MAPEEPPRRSAPEDLTTAVARAQDGDIRAFEHLVAHFERPLLRLCYRMLGNQPDAEDALQETFMGAWTKLNTLQSPEAFSTWLYRQGINHCHTILRARKRQASAVLDDDDQQIQVPDAAPTVDPHRQLEGRDSMDRLTSLLQQLPADQRAVWVLREMQEMSYGDISVALNIPAATVRGRLARARKTLADQMKEWR